MRGGGAAERTALFCVRVAVLEERDGAHEIGEAAEVSAPLRRRRPSKGAAQEALRE